jgi:MFS superfamily sulfate permease-like transporter
MARLGYEQFVPFIATVIGILLTDLLKGVAIGMAVAIFFILRKNYKHSYHYKKEKNQHEELHHHSSFGRSHLPEQSEYPGQSRPGS